LPAQSVYAELGRLDEARSAVAELLSIYPGFTLQTAAEEFEKFSASDELLERRVDALRKAGVPEEPSE
jgi:hypothetical protein